jgi:hypothetical protein
MLQNFLDSVSQFRQVLSALGRSFDMPIFAAGVSGSERAMLISGIEKRHGKPVLVITPDEASATKLSEDIAQLCEPSAVSKTGYCDFIFRFKLDFKFIEDFVRIRNYCYNGFLFAVNVNGHVFYS